MLHWFDTTLFSYQCVHLMYAKVFSIQMLQYFSQIVPRVCTLVFFIIVYVYLILLLCMFVYLILLLCVCLFNFIIVCLFILL